MHCAVMTPTYRYGGLDVNYACLLRTGLGAGDAWIIGDDLYEGRKAIVKAKTADAPFSVVHYLPRDKPDGYFSDLPGIYNEMLQIASAHGCELAISMQDYMWVEPAGVDRFIRAHQAKPKTLWTGTCSITGDPTPDDVVRPNGSWTVFRFDFEDTYARPSTISWQDVRPGNYPPGAEWTLSNPVDWELNWAAIPMSLFEAGCEFDETYGLHIGHENIEFAARAALDYGYDIWIDLENPALTLPHKQYWPEQEREGIPHADANMKRFWAEEYGQRLVIGR
jgi:hypothetical protein